MLQIKYKEVGVLNTLTKRVHIALKWNRGTGHKFDLLTGGIFTLLANNYIKSLDCRRKYHVWNNLHRLIVQIITWYTLSDIFRIKVCNSKIIKSVSFNFFLSF